MLNFMILCHVYRVQNQGDRNLENVSASLVILPENVILPSLVDYLESDTFRLVEDL